MRYMHTPVHTAHSNSTNTRAVSSLEELCCELPSPGSSFTGTRQHAAPPPIADAAAAAAVASVGLACNKDDTADMGTGGKREVVETVETENE